MGLDMYLNKRVYIWNGDYMDADKKMEVAVTVGGKPIDPVKLDVTKAKYVIEETVYWRKANQIHKWFVDNVQDGNDDCGEYYVNNQKLRELLATVEKVLQASKLVPATVTNGFSLKEGEWTPNLEDGQSIENAAVAEALLPTGEGFFFGSTDYNQWYYEQLEYTKEALTNALKDETAMYYYQSSW